MDYIVTEAGLYSQRIPVIAKTLALPTCMSSLFAWARRARLR
jgi:hypothetical protein